MRRYEVASTKEKIPVGATVPSVTMQAEGAEVTAADPGLGDLNYEITGVVEARSAYTTVLALTSSEDLGEVVMQSHRAAIREELVKQVVSGDGAGHNLAGIVGQTGIGSATFAEVDPGGMAWLEGSARSASTRNRLVEPGSFRRVVERERMTLSGIASYRSNSAIATTSALLADWGSIALVMQTPLVVIVDRLTRPGEVRITTRLAVASPIVTRPSRVYSLAQA